MQDTDTHPLIQRLALVTATERAAHRTGPTLWVAQAAVQDEANRIAHEEDTEDARQFLLAAATVTHAQYPQYAGYWDEWMLGTLTHNIELKGGGLPRCDVVLVKPVDGTFGASDEPSRSFYSARRDSNVATDPHRVRRSV